MIASVLRLSRSDFMTIRNRNNGVFDTYTMHKIVYSLFPKESESTRSFLFVYKGGDFYEKRILLLSKNMPLQPEIGTLESQQVPESFLQQDYYGFEVLVNPVRRDSKTGKIKPVCGRDDIAAWFTAKAGALGFEIIQDSLSISDTDVLQFTKDNKKVTLGKALCKGRLRVTDRTLFIRTFEDGIGKGKAFGFGLFQIVPLAN